MKPARLITIPISHYCEKAKWALDYGGIPYREEAHLQIFHFLPAYFAGRGDSVPVLVTEEGVFKDSTAILQWVNTKLSSDRKIYPEDPNLRSEVEALEDEFDEVLAPATRAWIYFQFLKLPEIAKKYGARGVPRYESLLFPVALPLIKKLICWGLEINEENSNLAVQEINRIFEKVEERLEDGRKFLMGVDFTAADLSFASLAAPVLFPSQYGAKLPELSELPQAIVSEIEKWRGHPAGKFALSVYERVRNHAPSL